MYVKDLFRENTEKRNTDNKERLSFKIGGKIKSKFVSCNRKTINNKELGF